MAEQVRDIAEQEPEQIRQQIQETRSAITEKLEALEEKVADTVENVKETIETTTESVQETVSTIKQTVEQTVGTVKETFDLRLQVQRHPWPMLGGALAAGVLTGALIGEARQRRAEPPGRLRSSNVPTSRFGEGEVYASHLHNGAAPRPGLFDRFQDEIAQVKGLALGLVFGVVRDVIQDNLPQMAEQVGEVMDRFTSKLGAAPVKGPVLHRAQERKTC